MKSYAEVDCALSFGVSKKTQQKNAAIVSLIEIPQHPVCKTYNSRALPAQPYIISRCLFGWIAPMPIYANGRL